MSRLNVFWYVNVNDLTGGYCIGTTEGKLSLNQFGDNIADFIGVKEIAEYIVKLHNDRLENGR